ncbi:MAG: thioredoxin domain-containing protein, partial [candidate division KSB1 bacterium]|nr:thioredoxin domain-containing protein [candidate division KSB1 bacterium]
MRISNGHAVVFAFAVLALAGLVASHFKLHHVVLPPPPLAVAQQLAEDDMNPFAADFAEHLAHGRKPNRLIHEKSPYLLQHAFNPVDWYPWGEEAFAKARRENKPIFLSIGYATCHWCHVMERESFENDSIAALMNEHYVCIKVDREERPDVDRVYMAVVQALTGAGGWPLSAWLTPELKPFYAGTYFPPEPRHGRPGFPQLLLQLSRVWREQRAQVLATSTQIIQAMQQEVAAAEAARPVDFAALARHAFAQFRQSYDERLGGFGGAPKFPRPAVFHFLLRYYARTQEKSALAMTLHTLRCMWAGGIYDHLGGGFHRYAVDAYWRVPHFEKMLYDQAQLACAYLEAYQLTREEFYARVAREVLDYVLRDMTHPEGGFYSAEDADSAPDPAHPAEKEEGACYLWRKQEIVNLLGGKQAEIFCYLYGVSDSGNTISDPHGEFRDRNVLYAARTPAEAAAHFALPETAINEIRARGRAQLFAARLQRPRPLRDDKIITAWNGLMISAFARAYQVLEERVYLEAAQRAAAFVLARNFDPAGATLKRRYRDGE